MLLVSMSMSAQKLKGDMNHNGKLDIEDITMLIEKYLTMEEPTDSPSGPSDSPSGPSAGPSGSVGEIPGAPDGSHLSGPAGSGEDDPSAFAAPRTSVYRRAE